MTEVERAVRAVIRSQCAAWNDGDLEGFIAQVGRDVVYDLTHYYIHHAKPKTRVGKALRAHHNKHHHNRAYKDLKFGVSTTVWDHVFGTYEVADKRGA